MQGRRFEAARQVQKGPDREDFSDLVAEVRGEGSGKEWEKKGR